MVQQFAQVEHAEMHSHVCAQFYRLCKLAYLTKMLQGEA